MPDSAHLNFELEIISLSDGTLKSRVRNMPYDWPGEEVPSTSFEMPFSPNELDKILATLSGQRNAPLTERQQMARNFGKQLFDAVFANDIQPAYQESLKLAAAQNKSLRVRLVLEQAGQLANFPWEFLHDERDFLALSRSTPVVRFPRQMVVRPRVEITAPIRILVMIANPVDMPPLNVEEEKALLQRATKRLRDEGLIKIDYFEEATLLNLQRKLREEEYHIFHYIGHSGYDEVTGVGWLSLQDRLGEGNHEPVQGVSLARELSEENTIRLVVMNSCHGARQNELNPAGGIASSLVTRGIPAVVANQFEISNEAAALFAEEFYTAIAEGLPVDIAVSEGRRAVSGTLQNTEWATPVLYLRATDDQLFDFNTESFTEGLSQLHKRSPFLVWGAVGLITALLIIASFIIFRGNDDGNVVGSPTPVPQVDLQVKNMQFSTNRPAPGEFLNVSIIIENLGPNTSPPARLEFLGDDQDGRTLVVDTVPSIEPGATDIVQIPFRFNWFGTFISRAFLDPDQELNDPNRRNNIRTLPAITSEVDPFVIDFSDALPNGERITESQIVPANIFNVWGFRLTVVPNGDETCAAAVPWFKVQADGTVTVGTGLPNDASSCADLTLVVTLQEQDDPTQEGTTGVVTVFYPTTATFNLTGYTDRERSDAFGTVTAVGNPAEPVSADLSLGIFDRQNLLAVEINPSGGPLLISELRFQAP